MTTVSGTTHQCSFPVQPPNGSVIAPGPCQCGKTWDRSKAEQMLEAAVAAMNATEPPDSRVGYEYDDVDDLRRGLVSMAGTWQQIADRYRSQDAPESARDAYVAGLTAATSSYVLAAVLGVAAKEYGEAAGKRLAWVAANIMINGDDDELNGDLR